MSGLHLVFETSSALAAYNAMDKSTFQGQILRVMPADDRRIEPEDLGKEPPKENRLRMVKENAARDFNRSILHMNVRLA